MILFNATGNSIDKTLFLKRPKNGCPDGTFDGMTTCFCENHCSWEVCRLVTPTTNCLISANAFWNWNTAKDAWVAKGISYC